MKQHKISGIIKKRFRNLNGLFQKIITVPETETIHKFRTEIKKLRAFLRLLNKEIGKEDHLSVAEKIKEFYTDTGIIRNLQLQLKSIDSYLENSHLRSPVHYFELLNAAIRTQEKKVLEFAGTINFNQEVNKIAERLPVKFKRASAKKFIHKKLAELRELLTRLPNEEAVHGIRKILKDILYSWNFVQQYHKLLPPGLQGKKYLRSFTETLGSFNDKCIGLSLLDTHSPAIAEAEEKSTLEKIRQIWQLEKDILEKQIQSQFSPMESRNRLIINTVSTMMK